MGKVVERIVNAERVEDLITVFGSFDENIKRIEEALNVRVVNRGTDLRVSGDEEMADKAVRTLEGLLSLAAKGETIDEQQVRYLIALVNEGNDAQVGADGEGCGVHHRQGKTHQGQDRRSAELHEGHHEEHHHHRRRPRGYRQDLSGSGRRRGGLPGSAR